jgi:hypothetical protein
MARVSGLLAVVLLAVSAAATPREPGPPFPEFSPVLLHESFDALYSRGVTNAQWVIPGYGTLVESWSGYALERVGLVTPCVVPGLDSSGRLNLAPEGALRLWVRPYWSSSPGGSGPGAEACVVEMRAVLTFAIRRHAEWFPSKAFQKFVGSLKKYERFQDHELCLEGRDC